jgi:hypothetical protein
MPFYEVYIRSFLRHHFGDAMWLKGNAGGERAAWLIYNLNLKQKVDRLLSEPLESGSIFKVTATLDDAGEIMRHYLKRGEMEVQGKINLPEISLGKKEPPTIGPRPWWEIFKWKKGFWMSVPKLSILASDTAKKHYNHISADHVTAKEDKKGIILGLHNYVETSLNLRGVGVNQLMVDQEPDDEKGNPSFYLWEKDVKKWIDEGVTIDQVVRDEPSWKDYLDTIKIGGE